MAALSYEEYLRRLTQAVDTEVLYMLLGWRTRFCDRIACSLLPCPRCHGLGWRARFYDRIACLVAAVFMAPWPRVANAFLRSNRLFRCCRIYGAMSLAPAQGSVL